MSNHLSGSNLEPPGGDPRVDLTDLFVFTPEDNPDRTVLIMNSNPFLQGKTFHPQAVYRFNVDTNGDSLADVAFSFTFSEPNGAGQTATAHYATGADAQTREPRGETLIAATPVQFDGMSAPVDAGPCKLFIGARSDPFFADANGVLQWLTQENEEGLFKWTGTDTFGDGNILTIALDVPNAMLANGSPIGVWITTSVDHHGELVPADREGNPSFNPILNADAIKDEFNATDPVDDVKNYLEPLSKELVRHGYAADEARTAALTLLPDILHYDRAQPAHYPNGRVPTDDVWSARMIFMTHGEAKPQSIKPHADLTNSFPYLGVPHPNGTPDHTH